MRIIGRFFRDQRGTMVGDIGKAAAAIALLSVLAANWLSHGVSEMDRQTMQQLASNAARGIKERIGYDDPVVTGSISKRAADTKLDPCVDKPRR